MYFHGAIPLDMELEKNLYKTYLRSIYILFSGDVKEPKKNKGKNIADIVFWSSLLTLNEI